ncbi:MAG TPA: DUF1501 domain-containing protein, partial [Gemmataceae bacterium]|nr:DUF1501 domain-containing protein [Gemmataceae bacterium]
GRGTLGSFGIPKPAPPGCQRMPDVPATTRRPDRPTRRALLRAAAVGGLSLPAFLRATASAPPAPPGTDGFGRARRCVVLFLTGGPPQLDTFDPKPDAPAEVRGELRPIVTTAPGVRVAELCTRLAGQADKFRIVRSVTHPDTVHTSAGYTMLTGAAHPKANARTAADIRPAADDHPHLGSLLASTRPPAPGPAFVSLPEVIKDAGVNEFPGQGAGFLGARFDPFRIEAGPDRAGFRLPDIDPPADVPDGRIESRRRLLGALDRPGGPADRDAYYEQAFDLIRSPAVHRALRLDREPVRTREAYGPHLFGQGCLLARRLLEAGVPLVTVYWHYEGPDDSPVWDTHANNFRHLRERLVPPADRAAAFLLEDLSARGLLDDTLVVVMGEFGRSPRVNRQAGRDHWPHCQSILLAGAGLRGGSVYGTSDRTGGYPADAPVSPADLTATFLHLLGMPPDTEIRDRTGRPHRPCTGTPVRGLLG